MKYIVILLGALVTFILGTGCAEMDVVSANGTDSTAAANKGSPNLSDTANTVYSVSGDLKPENDGLAIIKWAKPAKGGAFIKYLSLQKNLVEYTLSSSNTVTWTDTSVTITSNTGEFTKASKFTFTVALIRVTDNLKLE